MGPLVIAALLGFLAVALGAFGAHGLESALEGDPNAAERLAWWATGVRYQMWHALLLVGVGVLRRGGGSRLLSAATVLVVGGALLFSGSLYALTLTEIKILGAITPLGGLCFLAAWACVLVYGLKKGTAS